MKSYYSEEKVQKLLLKYKFDNSEWELQRLPLEKEAHLGDLIRQGNYHEVMKIKSFSDMAPNLGKTALNPKKNMEYYTVSAIALACRAAIDGGVPPDDAFDLSDVLLQELETAHTVEEINDIFRLAMVTFAKGVYYARKNRNSYAVEQCKRYIANNIFKKIQLEDVAGHIGLHVNYLCKMFKDTEHITIHSYIQREKVETACHMLKYTNRTIGEISQLMSFQSQSNFGAIFKKWKGMTPNEYRNFY